jgi:hypothetical protein
MTDEHELPLHEVYRSAEIYGLQSSARIAKARQQIDLVMGLSDPCRLAEFASSAKNAPEARLLAKRKALASREERQRSMIDRALLEAATIGIARRTTPLGREIGHLDAERAGVPWPDAWLPPE